MEERERRQKEEAKERMDRQARVMNMMKNAGPDPVVEAQAKEK